MGVILMKYEMSKIYNEDCLEALKEMPAKTRII